MLRVAAADAAMPSRCPILKTAAALFRQGADAVLYGFLAVAWAHSLCGFAVEILARWVYGKGSAAEAIGATVRAACWFVMVRLFPVIFPLILMCVVEHAEFVKEKEKRDDVLLTATAAFSLYCFDLKLNL